MGKFLKDPGQTNQLIDALVNFDFNGVLRALVPHHMHIGYQVEDGLAGLHETGIRCLFLPCYDSSNIILPTHSLDLVVVHSHLVPFRSNWKALYDRFEEEENSLLEEP